MKFVMLLAAIWSQTAAPPYVQPGRTVKISPHVWVIPDGRVDLVPNIGIIAGSNATLVVDSGMGPRNGEVTLREVQKISPNAQLYLTSTHFHPEHVSGFQAFPTSAKLIRPSVQQEELITGTAALTTLFSKMSPVHAALLKDVKMRPPDLMFTGTVEIDLGGVTARLFMLGPAHTRGDNFVLIKEDNLLFAGDVVTNRFFPIILDQSPASWITILGQLASLAAATVVPGHGEVADTNLIVRERAFLLEMQARTRELKNQRKSADEAAVLLSKELKSKYPDWGNADFLGPGIRSLYAEAP